MFFSFPNEEVLKLQSALEYLTAKKSHCATFEINFPFSFAVFLLSLPVAAKIQCKIEGIS